MSDDELSARLAEGDDYALAAVFDRHVIALYDFVARLLGDADAGATAVRTTFVRAWNSPAADSGCRVPLFTAGYAAALESLKARPGRPTTSALALGLAEVEPALVPGGTDLVRHQELAGLVWVWASRLKRRDYAVADLHLRHGFDPGEIGRVVGLRPGAVTARLARLASEAQGAMAPAVLARRTPIECPALEVAVFALPGDTPLPAVSRVVRTHIGRCAICRNSQRGLASPLGLLSTMTPVALPQDRREEMWAAIALGATTRPPRARVKPPVHHLHHLHRPVVPRPVAAAGLALGVVAIALGVVLARSDDPSPGSDVGAPVGLASATHVVGASSPRSLVSVSWTKVAGAEGYSVRWSQGADDLPDREVDLSADAVRTTSPELTPGSWWFHLRTRSPSGSWTGAGHLGPFVIIGPPTTTTTLAVASTTTLPPLPASRVPPVTLVPITTTTTTLPATTLPPPPTTTSTTVPPTTTTVPPTTSTTVPPTTTTVPPTTTSTTVPPTTTTTVPPTTTSTTAAPPPAP